MDPSKISPEMLALAKKMANGPMGKKIVEEMRKNGMDPSAVAEQFKQEMKLRKEDEPKRKVLHITTSRKCKVKSLPTSTLSTSSVAMLPGGGGVELPCSRVSVGGLEGREIKAVFDPERKGRNRRVSKIVGFDVGSDLILFDPHGDLTEEQLLSAESLLE